MNSPYCCWTEDLVPRCHLHYNSARRRNDWKCIAPRPWSSVMLCHLACILQHFEGPYSLHPPSKWVQKSILLLYRCNQSESAETFVTTTTKQCHITEDSGLKFHHHKKLVSYKVHWTYHLHQCSTLIVHLPPTLYCIILAIDSVIK